MGYLVIIEQPPPHLGATIVENCGVNTLKVNDDGLVYGAETDIGYIECKNFVNTAGLVMNIHKIPSNYFYSVFCCLPIMVQWAPRIPIESNAGLRVNIASQLCYFSYMATNPFQGTSADMPSLKRLRISIRRFYLILLQ